MGRIAEVGIQEPSRLRRRKGVAMTEEGGLRVDLHQRIGAVRVRDDGFAGGGYEGSIHPASPLEPAQLSARSAWVMPMLGRPARRAATTLGTAIVRMAKISAPPTTWKNGLADPNNSLLRINAGQLRALTGSSEAVHDRRNPVLEAADKREQERHQRELEQELGGHVVETLAP